MMILSLMFIECQCKRWYPRPFQLYFLNKIPILNHSFCLKKRLLSAFNVYKRPILQNFKSCKSCFSGSWQTFKMVSQGFDAMFINILTHVLHILPRVSKENVQKWMTFLVQPFVKCCLVTRYFLKVSFMFQVDKTIQRCKYISKNIC